MLDKEQIQAKKAQIDASLEEISTKKEQQALLNTFEDYEGKDRIITSQEAYDLLENERLNPPKKIMSGLPKLDKMVNGFRAGDLIIVSGITKHGKTALCQSFTHHFAENDVSSLWFSYELRQLEFLEKFGQPLPYFTLPKSLTERNMAFVERKIIEGISKYDTKIIFVDHLHYLLDMETLSKGGGNVSLIIGALLRKLKTLALEWGITIFLIAHTTKIEYDRKPQLSDLRDSSFLGQESDTVLMIQRLKEEGPNVDEELFSNESDLWVVANRRTGETGKIGLKFNKGKFYEHPPQPR